MTAVTQQIRHRGILLFGTANNLGEVISVVRPESVA
jgi:hypothetical protein